MPLTYNETKQKERIRLTGTAAGDVNTRNVMNGEMVKTSGGSFRIDFSIVNVSKWPNKKIKKKRLRKKKN